MHLPVIVKIKITIIRQYEKKNNSYLIVQKREITLSRQYKNEEQLLSGSLKKEEEFLLDSLKKKTNYYVFYFRRTFILEEE